MTGPDDTKIDYASVHRFWEERAASYLNKDTVNVSNLEPDTERAREKHRLESQVLHEYLDPRTTDQMLDLGAGHGGWASEFAREVAWVTCVEYSESMVELARENFRVQNIANAEIRQCAAQNFRPERMYDKVLISGLLIYLSDEDVRKLLKMIGGTLADDGRLVLRDGTGRQETYTLKDVYSEALGASYSAHYRTAREYITMFEDSGFECVRSRDMFEDGSPFNKWVETVLRVYEFRKH